MLRRIGWCCLLAAPLLLVPVPVPGQGRKSRYLTVEQVQQLLEQTRAKHKLPALAAGVVQRGRLVWAAVGVRKRGTDVQVTRDDMWHLGSNSKPLTALLIAWLVDRGLLGWDTPLERIFPELAGDWKDDLKKVTPAHLLTHTSGLPENWPLGWFLVAGKDAAPAAARAEVMKRLGKIEQPSRPGEKYQYSNLGYVVLGAISDRVGKLPYEEQMQRHIFQRLGIKSGGFGPPRQAEPLLEPWPHQADGAPVPPGTAMDNPPVLNSAGRIHMSASDYNRFLLQALQLARGGRWVFQRTTVEKLFSNLYPVSPHSLSGWLGYRKQRAAPGLVLEHDGSNRFNYCSAIAIADRNVAIAVFTNQGTVDGPGEAACHELRDALEKLAR